MSKVHSGYLLLLTLVFSTAQAPTFQIWRNLSATASDDLQAAALGSGRATRFNLSDMTAAPQRDYAEDGDLKRFQLDEMNLPKLDVSLPELFDWSDIEQTYLADAVIPDDASGFALDSSHAAAFRIASLDSAYMSIGGGRFGGTRGVSGTGDSDGVIGATGPSDDTTGPGASSPGHSGKGASGGTESLPGEQSSSTETPPPNDSPSITTPIEDPTPVPVPAPGALGLVALGLAGLRLAGRNKNRSG